MPSVPYLGIGFHVLVAICFAIHAVRTQQNMFWLLILFIFPFLGSVVYLFAVYLPGLRQTRGLHVARRTLVQWVDPARALRQARHDFERAPTVQHRMRLAAALLDSGDKLAALQQYQTAASGPFADDPALLQGLAAAQYATDDFAGAEQSLDRLFATQPQTRQQSDSSLLYARIQAALGAPQTRAAFEQALSCANDAAARCLYADWLSSQADAADRERARGLYAQIVQDARHWPRHTQEHNREWLQRARSAAV